MPRYAHSQSLLGQLFPQGHDVRRAGDLLHGAGQLNERTIAVIGSTERAAIGGVGVWLDKLG